MSITTEEYNIMEENQKLIHRILASINIPEDDMTAMLNAYRNSVFARIEASKDQKS
jgi:hypothetical protein